MGKEISKKITTLVLTLVFSCGAVIFVAVPLYRDLKIAKLEIEMERENKTAREEFLSRMDDFKKINKDIQKEDLEKISQVLLNRNGYEDYLSRVIYLAQINNVIVKDFSVSEPSVPARIKTEKSEEPSSKESPLEESLELRETAISFSALGGFHDFMAFIDDFEKMGPLADEESLSISATRSEINKKESEGESGENQKQEEGLVLSYEVDFKFYY